MAESQEWMTAERVERDREILHGFVTDTAASRRDPDLASLCAETLAGGDADRIVALAGTVRMVRACWA